MVGKRTAKEGSRFAGALVLAWLSACSPTRCDGAVQSPTPQKEEAHSEPHERVEDEENPRDSEEQRKARRAMVEDQLKVRGIEDPLVLDAMSEVPRHLFMPEGVRYRAYEDRASPIGYDQTISQPYVVALMTELAEVKKGSKVLEVGTGSGYQAAVLAAMGATVYSIEIVEPLAKRAQKDLKANGYDVTVRHGDGYRGWPEHAPFDAVLVTAAPPEVPEPLKQQLRVGGRLVVPVGRGYQSLKVITRTADAFKERDVLPVAFVPMTGEAQE